MPQDLTIRELQTNLPWTVRYSADFRATPMAHKDFAHALTHVHKAGGMLAALVDDMDHRKEVADDPAIRESHAKYVADLVVCALRMANTFPGGVLDLQRAVEDRLESKNDVKLPRPAHANAEPMISKEQIKTACSVFMDSGGTPPGHGWPGTMHMTRAFESAGLKVER